MQTVFQNEFQANTNMAVSAELANTDIKYNTTPDVCYSKEGSRQGERISTETER